MATSTKSASKPAVKTAARPAASTGPKTVATDASVPDFIAAIADETRRADCDALCQLMQAATGAPPVMWGGAIVGFGAYAMRYANGSSLNWPVIAFSPRKTDLTLYLMPGLEGYGPLLQRLGKHKTGKVCLYVKRLADLDMGVLHTLVQAAVQGLAAQRVDGGEAAVGQAAALQPPPTTAKAAAVTSAPAAAPAKRSTTKSPRP